MGFHLFQSQLRGLPLSNGNIVSAYIQVCNPACLSDNSTRNGGIGYIICLVYLRLGMQYCTAEFLLSIFHPSSVSFLLPPLSSFVFLLSHSLLSPFSFPSLTFFISTRTTSILLGDRAKKYRYTKEGEKAA